MICQSFESIIYILLFHGYFSNIYKIICKGFKERLFDDVKQLIHDHIIHLKADLEANVMIICDEILRKYDSVQDALCQFRTLSEIDESLSIVVS